MSNLAELDSGNFEQLVLKATKPVFVDFWASWCGPCRALAPLIDEIAGEVSGMDFYKCNVDENRELSIKYRIASIPTLMIFVNGEVADTIIGAVPKETLMKQIEKHIA